MFGAGMQHPSLRGIIPQGDAALAQAMQPATSSPFNLFDTWQGLRNPTINVNLTQSPPPSALESIVGNPMVLQLVLGLLGSLASRFQNTAQSEKQPVSSGKPWDWGSLSQNENPWQWGSAKTGAVMKKQAADWHALLTDLAKYYPYAATGASIGLGLGGLIPLITYGTEIKQQPDFNKYSRQRLLKAVLYGMLTGGGLGLASGVLLNSISDIASRTFPK